MMGPRASYSLFMLLALLVFVVTRHLLPRPAGLSRLPWWQRTLLAASAFAGGVLGAKLPFALSSDAGLFSDLAWLSDGKTITTGLIGAYVGVEIAKLGLGVDVKTGDTFALPLALALVVGRWGCFCNGCCYGIPTDLPWGVDFGDGQLRHPTQVYESLFHLLMAGVLVAVMRRHLFPYQRLKLYLIAYGVYRFLTEYIRPESAEWLDLTFYQCMGVVLVVGLSIQWWFDRRRWLYEHAVRTEQTAQAALASQAA
jgi:phosphatidylglycerol:prolipoprotein diacylglycerol transferase